ncbi:unnamed protein product [Effrenium voratum]|uniref:SET domain-containing protein n=2 Tax=Effrenium voratum TaxID=2562239 RepID=A0AA36IF72_9DINO|nr:unnamed protein product [Effrenium voratum]CAJ1443187.1 unnamed protein product [Effrenium voratum]
MAAVLSLRSSPSLPQCPAQVVFPPTPREDLPLGRTLALSAFAAAHGSCKAAKRAARLRRAAMHGLAERLPQHSTVYLTGLSPDLEGEPCEVLGFDPSAKRWLLRFLHPRFENQSCQVPEQCFTFGYCVQPGAAALGGSAAPGGAAREAKRRPGLGRGLEAAEQLEQGQVIFEECPFLITADDVNEVCRAYFKMRAASGDSPGALDAFNRLSAGEHFSQEAVQRCEAQAAQVWQAATSRAASPLELRQIAEVLRRWEANRFLQGAGGAGRGRAGRYALFSWVSLLNHSCQPSAMLDSLSALQSGALPEDGKSRVKALRGLAPGEAICINYGPPELLEWDVARRREYLQRQNGFTCRCPRCLTEAKAKPQGEEKSDLVSSVAECSYT